MPTAPAPKHVYEIYIRTTPEKLWAALTDGEMTKGYFFGTSAKSTWKPGAALSYVGPKGEAMVEGKVVEIDPPKKLVITWSACYDADVKKDRPSRVTFAVEKLGPTCKLSMLHDEFDGETKTFHSTGNGWPVVLSGLKTLLETGEPLPMPAM